MGPHRIGEGYPTYVIAEAGVNHNGDLALAKKLVLAAKRTGADCVKFQTFKAENLVTDSAPKAAYQLKTTSPTESQFQMLKKLELPFSAYQELMKLCREQKIQFLSTPYSFEDVDFLMELGVEGFKIASGQVAEPAFLDYVARKEKPLIVSVGMATVAEIAVAVDTIRSAGNEQFCLLQCTTNYPTTPEEANLRVLQTLRDSLGVVMGYSDHIPENHCAVASVALGASVIEKHFTLDRSMEGPDHSSSLDEAGFADLVRGIRQVEAALGDGIKRPMEKEKLNIRGMRRSIVARRDIQQGEAISLETIAFKRPATGLLPADLNRILGKRATRKIGRDEFIQFDSIEWKN